MPRPKLTHGVMVTQQILVLLFEVRILVGQQFRVIAQLVAFLLWEQEVVGSSPAHSTESYVLLHYGDAWL